MTTQPAPKRRLSPWTKFLLWTLVPLFLLAVILMIVDSYGRSRLDSAVREARAGGGPVTFDELMAARHKWADEQNGALLLVKLADRLGELSRDEEITSLPAFSRHDSPLGYRLPQDQESKAEAQLVRLAPDLDRIDQLARYQGGAFPISIAADPFNTLLPHLAHVRTSAKLKASQMQMRALKADDSRLVEDFSVLQVHGQLLADEPTLISALVRVACDALCVEVLERICALSHPGAEQLAKLQKRIAGMKNQDRLSWGMRGERAFFIDMQSSLRRQGGGATGNLLSLPAGVGKVPGVRGWLMQDASVGLRMHNRLVRSSHNFRKAWETAGEVSRQVEKSPAYNVITRLMMPSLERAFELSGILEARLRAAEAALAAERYRLDQGTFPPSLEALVPRYLEQVPLDPFTDQPMRYLSSAERVVIYSVGEDETDNSGDVVRTKSQPAKDHGFTLLPPQRRGLPSTQPAEEPESPPATSPALEPIG